MDVPRFSNPDSLGVLMAMVNETLIETGRSFRAEGSLQASTQLKRSIPAAHGQFQRALDDLTEQIFIAKAFLERDYDAVLAKKNAPPRTDVEGSTKEVDTTPTPPKAEDSAPEIDVPIKSEEKEEAGPQESVVRGPGNASPSAVEAAVVKLEKPPDQDVAPPAPSGAGAEVGTGAGAGAGAGDDTDEINFDAILNETTEGGGPNEFDLHLDFENDEMGNQNFLAQSNFVSQEQQEQPQPQQQQPPPDGREGSMEEFGTAGELSFNDLFIEGDSFGGDGGAGGEGGGGDGTDANVDGDGLVNLDELDSNWFNT